jgi:hypothetical protein
MDDLCYTAAQLAAMKLSGMPGSVRGMIDYARKNGWASCQVPGKGGKGGMRTEYAFSSFSKEVRDAIEAKRLRAETC